MQKYNNIKALFFLGIFNLLLLHQALSHLHHQHEVEHTHKSVAHNDSHSHQHDVPEKENSKKDFLSLFLDLHVHSLMSNELLLTHESSVKQLSVKKNVSTPISNTNYSIYTNYDEVEKATVYRPPNIYFNSYRSSLDSRGPPSLG